MAGVLEHLEGFREIKKIIYIFSVIPFFHPYVRVPMKALFSEMLRLWTACGSPRSAPNKSSFLLLKRI